jgi:hypothetical protein
VRERSRCPMYALQQDILVRQLKVSINFNFRKWTASLIAYYLNVSDWKFTCNFWTRPVDHCPLVIVLHVHIIQSSWRKLLSLEGTSSNRLDWKVVQSTFIRQMQSANVCVRCAAVRSEKCDFQSRAQRIRSALLQETLTSCCKSVMRAVTCHLGIDASGRFWTMYYTFVTFTLNNELAPWNWPLLQKPTVA